MALTYSLLICKYPREASLSSSYIRNTELVENKWMHDHDVTVHTETPHEEEETTGCCVMPPERRIENLMDLERADSNIEIARVKVADADVRILRASNYVKVSTNGVRVSIVNGI